MVLSAMLSITMAAPSTVGVFFFCNVIIVAILITSSFKSSSDVQEEPAAASRFKDGNNTRLLADECVDAAAAVVVVADHEVTRTQDDDENPLYCSGDASDQKTGVLVVDEVSRAAATSSVVDIKVVVCRGESRTSVKDDDTNALFSSDESTVLMTADEVSPARTSAFTKNELRIHKDDGDDNNDKNNHENCDDELKRRSEDFIEQVVRQWKAERVRSYCVQVE